MIETVWISWEEQQNLKRLAETFSLFDDETLFSSLPLLKQEVKNILSPETWSALNGFMPGDGNILRVNGLPFDYNIQETPYTGYVDNADLPIASVMQFAVFAACDIFPISYLRENKGLLFRHVVPTRKRAKRVSSHGSALTLDMHVSNPILPIIPEETHNVSGSPEVLAFYGVRPDPDVFTEVVELDEVLAQLEQHVIDELCEKKYFFRMPSSFNGDELKGPLAILGIKEGMYYNRTDMDTVIPVDYPALVSLNVFMEATKKVKNYHRLQLPPGDMLLFKNQRTLHSRQKFVARYNGLDRWMVRLYGSANMARHHAADESKRYLGLTY
ncbi:TauD/TfdA family dioxygenase [Erwinia sp. BNK-24-b]|uniref:TauD/TfdA family dioxygenase n=1 Tax=unclassified Erwinia TaxID=2622719 RepID=UPI0039BEF4CF